MAASNSDWEGTSTAFALALGGRFVFGLGGETLSVVQNAFVAKWFSGGSDLATAFAIVYVIRIFAWFSRALTFCSFA
jgi:hypothetical protein